MDPFLSRKSAKTLCFPCVFAILASPKGAHFGTPLSRKASFFLAWPIKMGQVHKWAFWSKNKPGNLPWLSGNKSPLPIFNPAGQILAHFTWKGGVILYSSDPFVGFLAKQPARKNICPSQASQISLAGWTLNYKSNSRALTRCITRFPLGLF